MEYKNMKVFLQSPFTIPSETRVLNPASYLLQENFSLILQEDLSRIRID